MTTTVRNDSASAAEEILETPQSLDEAIETGFLPDDEHYRLTGEFKSGKEDASAAAKGKEKPAAKEGDAPPASEQQDETDASKAAASATATTQRTESRRESRWVGPVGLSAVMTARLYGPSKVIAIDLDNARLARAADFGATDTVNSGDPDWKDQVLALTDGLGVDVAIEAVGVPETFTMATVIVRPGGNVANIGVHGKSVDLALNELWIKNIDISMGLVNTNTLSMLLKLVAEHKLPAEKFVTHEFSFDQMLEAYDVFGHAAEHDALKVLIH